MRSKPFASEQELAEVVIRWLQDHHWEVYQEVPVGSGIADIVAKQGPATWLIETKLSMSIALIKQIDTRVGYANFTSVAVPSRKKWDVPTNFFRALGIGTLSVYPAGHSYRPHIEEHLHPRFLRRAAGIELYEEQKTFCGAGSSSGGHWTPFKETSRNVRSYVIGKPGCTVSEMLRVIKHHYGSPESASRCIVRWIEGGVIPGIKIDRSERALKLYPEEAA